MTIYDTSPRPSGFGTGRLYSRPLSVYFLEGRYYVFDYSPQGAFLCSVDSVEELAPLLQAQAARPEAQLCARDLVYPGYSAEVAARRQAADAALPKAPPRALTKLSLEDLDL